VHPTGGTLRVFKQFSWLGAGSDKIALSRPAHQRVTQAVSPLASHSRELASLLSARHVHNCMATDADEMQEAQKGE